MISSIWFIDDVLSSVWFIDDVKLIISLTIASRDTLILISLKSPCIKDIFKAMSLYVINSCNLREILSEMSL